MFELIAKSLFVATRQNGPQAGHRTHWAPPANWREEQLSHPHNYTEKGAYHD